MKHPRGAHARATDRTGALPPGARGAHEAPTSERRAKSRSTPTRHAIRPWAPTGGHRAKPWHTYPPHGVPMSAHGRAPGEISAHRTSALLSASVALGNTFVNVDSSQ
eukprot:3029906-Pyramimonas_sp.AAC.1